MAEQTVLGTMALRLRQAVAAKDWTALASLDRELASLLRRLAGKALSRADQRALEQVRQAHAEGQAACARELELSASRLATVHERRGGFMAYALNGAQEEERE
ncbi:MAG TPA: hypothetical protein VIL32_13105 [Steroidobacteraceae bacterium]|jgi:hypothetical protein